MTAAAPPRPVSMRVATAPPRPAVLPRSAPSQPHMEPTIPPPPTNQSIILNPPLPPG